MAPQYATTFGARHIPRLCAVMDLKRVECVLLRQVVYEPWWMQMLVVASSNPCRGRCYSRINVTLVCSCKSNRNRGHERKHESSPDSIFFWLAGIRCSPSEDQCPIGSTGHYLVAILSMDYIILCMLRHHTEPYVMAV